MAVVLMCIVVGSVMQISGQETRDEDDGVRWVIPRVRGTSPRSYQELTGKTPAIDLQSPDNVEVVTEYDAEKGVYGI